MMSFEKKDLRQAIAKWQDCFLPLTLASFLFMSTHVQYGIVRKTHLSIHFLHQNNKI